MVGEEIVYHGSPCREIATGKFKRGKTGFLGPGIYFSTDKYYANRYAKKYGSGAIYEVEINLDNPLVLTDETPTKDFLTAVYKTETVYKRREQQQSNTCYIIQSKDIKKFLSMGYDGVIWDFAGSKEYVVYDNSKIRILNKEIIQESKNEEKVTFFRFLSEMKGFLGRLLKDPIGAQPSKFLKNKGLTKTRIINLLLKKDVLERHEKILTPDKTGEKKVQYCVSYKVKRKDFERKMKRIHTKYFEKNLPEQLNEEADMTSCANIVGVVGGKGQGVGAKMCDRWAGYVNDAKDTPRSVFANEDEMKKAMLKDERDKEAYLTRGGMKGIDECDAGATTADNSGQYSGPLGGVQRRKIYFTEDQINYIKEHKDMAKKVIFTEAQWNYIMESCGVNPEKLNEMECAGATSTASVGAETSRGDVGYDANCFSTEKDKDFWDDSMTHNKKGDVSCDSLDKNGKAPK